MGSITLKEWLKPPVLKNKDLDDPETTILKKDIVRKNAFLNKIYREWYLLIANSLPRISGQVLELGSGPGFLKEYIPQLITSDITPLPGMSLVVDGGYFPFLRDSLRAITAVNVLHHFGNMNKFISEASRCLRAGGVIIAIEPWNSKWSRFVYTNLHHEPFCPDCKAWQFESTGALTSANGALPWIIFHRDSGKFKTIFPDLSIHSVIPIMPFSYLLSGGFSLRQLVPGLTFRIVRYFEKLLDPWVEHFAMFSIIVIRKNES